ncbi:protein SET DOMAIN GROUP 41 [Rutidosis leptorrhynchoides]|uniref:protein SET DOMAIN GROUP 41 n=1 Tax=Rutidosis leptorrhynchoides TaxID=125765 RepID=UPI003A994FED
MEMVATTEVGPGEDLIPPLVPIAYSLHDSFITSHCASCFSILPHNPFGSLDQSLLYCSPSCSSSHSPLHISSGSHNLSVYKEETSDLRVALLLLLQIKRQNISFKSYDRLCGLMTNRHKLLDDHEISTRIKNGARAMGTAISITNGSLDTDSLLVEAVYCAVITNAVEIQDKIGRSVGIALYDTRFSWINHSCSPNSCYRFLMSENECGNQRCLITPVSSNGSKISTTSDFQTGLVDVCGGPRIVVRSIKAIKKGDPVTVTYIGLLQPKELRQFELWFKYRFTCFCHRCVAVPLTYIDQLLQEICYANENGNFLQNVGVESFTDYINDAIDDYLTSNDAESCRKKLEDVLLKGFRYEQLILRLHPLNHLSLNAYTTLASTYKTRAITLEDENALKWSVAYLLLLAFATHNLFLSESSLIASVSTFWIATGELLLYITKTAVSSDITNSSMRCSKCKLIDIFDTKFDPNKLLDISSDFLGCVTDITPIVWKFVSHGNRYLETIKDPSDSRWFETSLESVTTNRLRDVEAIMEGEERVALFWLGFHFLLYGGILSNIFSDHDSHLSCNVRNLLNL